MSLSGGFGCASMPSGRLPASSSAKAPLRVAPELADPVGPLEVGEHEDVKELLIDCEKHRAAARAVVFGLLAEMERK
jgi:hypothetical protein